MYKKIFIYIIICFMIILFRDNICFFLGNALGAFKLDNEYSKAEIKLKDEKIKYLENEIKEYGEFVKELDRIEYNYKISKIIYKNSYDIGKYTIQYGKNDKVNIGMGVVNEFGFIGKITNVDKKTSELTTIKDLKDVSVVINDNYGKMNYDYVNNQFIITDISNYDKVYVNNKVYTSGYGSIKEKLYIGKVESIDNDAISKKVYVKVDNDFNKLNYVLIVGDF